MRSILSFAEAPAPATLAMHAPGWHSPVPYLFGGLAAMLGLIAFALLILACSYWKLSGFPPEEPVDDPESGDSGQAAKKAAAAAWENNVLVIMAGQVLPTFLATPSTSRSSSFGDTSNSGGGVSTDGSCDGEKADKVAIELSESVAAAAVDDHQPVSDVSV